MHELSLAMALVEQVQRVRDAEGGGEVVSIRLGLGALAGVDREAFEFAFPLAAQDAHLDGAALVFEEVPAEITCDACGQVSRSEEMLFCCAACGSDRVRITGGRDFWIMSVEMQVDDPAEKDAKKDH